MSRRICLLALSLVVATALSSAAHAAAFDVHAATDAYLATVSGAARAKSDAYFEGGYWLILWDALVTVGICLLLLLTRASAGMRNIAERLVRWRGSRTFIYSTLFLLSLAVLSFPMTLYEG